MTLMSRQEGLVVFYRLGNSQSQSLRYLRSFDVSLYNNAINAIIQQLLRYIVLRTTYTAISNKLEVRSNSLQRAIIGRDESAIRFV